MSHIRGAVLVIGMLIVSAVAVASASATLPEFEGSFPKHFVATQTGEGELDTVGAVGEARDVKCTAGSALGFVRSEKDVLVAGGIKYTGCHSTKFGGLKCQSTATEGEIVTNQLLGLLGYTNKAKAEVGLLFEPDNASDFATFTCHTFFKDEHLLVRGTVICPISKTNENTDKFTLSCNATNGVQTPLSFENLGTRDTLETEGSGQETFAFEQSGVKASSSVLTLGATKINA